MRDNITNARKIWAVATGGTEQIAGDRRSDRRYEIQLDLRWKLIRRRRVLDTGVGHTLDLSSGGILFEAGRPMPPGLNVELSVSWPILLRNIAPMQLCIAGRIVRSQGGRTAIRMTQHEFRTAGSAPEERNVLSILSRTPSGLLGGSRLSTFAAKPH
jgi:hypothetical protein